MTGAGLEDFPWIYDIAQSAIEFRCAANTPRAEGDGLAPTKLYRPIVSVVAALSSKNDNRDLDLNRSQSANVCDSSRGEWAHLAETFR